ncbi:MAG: hypothetical protein J3K34DRAFT_410281 [Monoraphidium minutum]|nr:MAG: hypothetical protein J3K34DRAFT_410281 [Monoraphidium minutum]
MLTGCSFPRLANLCIHLEVFRDASMFTAARELGGKAGERVLLCACTTGPGDDFDRVAQSVSSIPNLKSLVLHAYGGTFPSSWERLAGSLTSLHILGGGNPHSPAIDHLDANICCGVTALTRLESLSLSLGFPASKGAPRKHALAIAKTLPALPCLAHLRFDVAGWEKSLVPTAPKGGGGATAAAAAPPQRLVPDAAALQLARCPRLRVLEVGHTTSLLWRHVHEDQHWQGQQPSRVPCPSPAWARLAAAFEGRRDVDIRPGPYYGPPFSSAAADNALAFEL